MKPQPEPPSPRSPPNSSDTFDADTNTITSTRPDHIPTQHVVTILTRRVGQHLGAIGDTATELFTANMNRATYFDVATPETGSRLFAIESSGTHVAWLDGSTITIADKTGTTKDFPVPDGIDGTDVVGLDIATTEGATENGMITVSYADHNPVVIDIADGSATEIEQSGGGLATTG